MLKEKLSNRGLTVVEVLVVLAIISVIVVFLFATLNRRTGCGGDQVSCQSNLRELQKLAVIYADSVGKGFLPLAEGPNPTAHASINILQRANDGIKPKMFVCRTWRGGVAAWRTSWTRSTRSATTRALTRGSAGR